MASNLAKKFEKAAQDAAAPKQSSSAASWGASDPPLPATKNDKGEVSASGMKAKFENIANPPPPKKQMGSVKWNDDADQGKKKGHKAGVDPTKPPPPKNIADLP